MFVYCDIALQRVIFFFFNDTATTEIYTLSLHDALPISIDDTRSKDGSLGPLAGLPITVKDTFDVAGMPASSGLETLKRSEEHTSELQSRQYLVCRLLLEKKKKKSCR